MGLWYDEEHAGISRIGLKVERTLFMGQSPYQKIAIVETAALGRALLLDDTWMAAEGEERIYHEMIVHPALTTAPRICRVLVIGGGDGGTVREVLRYPEVERVDQVEIDEMVVQASQEYLPSIGTAWNDPRLNVLIGDGIVFVRDAPAASYEVILVDSSDPVGPAKGLFSESFYRDCHRLLVENGVLVVQSESPFAMRREHLNILLTLKAVFSEVHPYYGPVSIYPGGFWSWAYAPRGVDWRQPLSERMLAIEAESEYYNRTIHMAAFAQPNCVQRALVA
ncbi:MAG: polyamine aminopropyltransferase [Bradymonadales bacterium]|nr:polyamine aminopropyltransferase [Bradymonadales bacterium]